MKSVWIIAKRELSSYFDSLIAYMMIILFLIISGLFTWIVGGDVFITGQASLQVFFTWGYWTLFFFIPTITMRSLAEESRSGTIELLSTKAVTDWQIVLGKYLSSYLLVIIALACTIPYYITVANLGNIDHGAVIGGYLGLALISGAYVSIGIFASSTTNNQIVAILLSLLISVFFHFLFDVLNTNASAISSVLSYLSTRTHFQSLARGVIDSRDFIYFFSLIFIGLLLSQTMLSRRNWQS